MKMEIVKISEDVSFSRIILGFWRLQDWKLSNDELLRFMEEAVELGVTTFDHADAYGNYTVEAYFGDSLKKKPSLREKLQLITKCGIVYKSDAARVKYYDYSKRHIIGQVEKSLRHFGTDRIEMLILHRPSPMLNPEEVGDAFDTLLAQGKVRTFGVSNFKPVEFKALQSYLNVPLLTNQIELSALRMENLENGTFSQCMENRIHPLVWSPLAGGRIFTGTGEEEKRLRDTLEEIRAEVGADSIDEIAYAWILSMPSKPLAITGSGEIGLVRKPVEALKRKLTLEQWFMIWTAVKGHKVP